MECLGENFTALKTSEASSPLFQEAVILFCLGISMATCVVLFLIWHFLKSNHVQFKYLKFQVLWIFQPIKERLFDK